MISDEKFNKAKPDLYQEETITLLHETTQDKIEGILAEGLKLQKSYNGEISRVVNLVSTDKEFQEYNYYKGISDTAIAVISIPKSIFGNIPSLSFEYQLFINCLSQRQYPKISENNWLDYKAVPHERLSSIIPSKWINGIFDKDNNFIKNSAYILRQPNSEELLKLSRLEILQELKTRYPSHYKNLFEKNIDDLEYGYDSKV